LVRHFAGQFQAGQKSTRLNLFGGATGNMPAAASRILALPKQLYNPAAQEFMFSSQQLLHEIVAAFVHVARCAGKVIVGSHSRRAAKIICHGKDFIGRFTLTEQPLRVRTCRADRE
jgi:hypothetical protein